MFSTLEDILPEYPEITGVHPACVAIPVVQDEELKKLCDDVKQNGLLHEIVLSEDGLLVDGRHRLIACYEGQVEPRFTRCFGDPWKHVFSENILRRHWQVGQKAAYADAWLRDAEETAAKERQGTRTDIPATLPGSSFGDTRDRIGEMVGIGGRSVDKFRFVKEEAPEAAEAVACGEISLEAGYKEAQKRKRQKDAIPVENPKPADKPKPSDPMTDIVTASGKVSQIKLPAKVVFNTTNDSVDWANWTWNPVTGCEHGCNFCYAREIANSVRMADYYPNGFEPTFHEYRLDAPKNTKPKKSDDPRDGRVFVCSMADLFGKWVPDEWIEAVFAACLQSPKWEYLFLTKWPARYSQMPLINRAWYGASVIQQADVTRVENAMQKIQSDSVTLWISLEPMLGPIKFNTLAWCDLVVIGAQTSTNQPDGFVPAFAPEFDWIVDVVNQCRDAGVPYYLKENLGLTQPGMKLPKSQPRKP
jgi:protein gp37